MVEIRRVVSSEGKALELALKNLDGKVGKVGWFENSKYEDGTHVAGIAAQNEYGNPSKNIPARPFLRPTVRAKQNEWKDIAMRGSRAVLANKATAAQVMELIGRAAVADIQKTISLLQEPPLSPRTIAARLAKRKDKKHVGALTKPLIDTGIMFATLISIIEDA